VPRRSIHGGSEAVLLVPYVLPSCSPNTKNPKGHSHDDIAHLLLKEALRYLSAEVESAHILEHLARDRVPSPPADDLRCRRRPLGHEEVLEQPVETLGLYRLRVKYQEVVAEDALFLLTEHVGLQHLRVALQACDHERHGCRLDRGRGLASPGGLSRPLDVEGRDQAERV
jgi:hypothetical protein